MFLGGTDLPASLTGRTMISFYWLFSMVVVATYCGNMIAFLSVTKDTLPFDTLDELLDQDEYIWGTVGQTLWVLVWSVSIEMYNIYILSPLYRPTCNKLCMYLYHHACVIQTAVLPEYKKLWAVIVKFNKTEPDILSLSLKVHLDKVLAGGYAFVADKTSMEIAMATNCDLSITKEEFQPLKYSMGLQNHSPYTKLLSDE
jgi:hypothetical protein